MVQEKMHPHPTEKEAVIREIIPGGDAERKYFRYENDISARWVQKLDRCRLVPKLLVRLVDDGIEVDGSCLDLNAYPTEEFEEAVEASEETLIHDTIAAWRDGQYVQEQEMRHAA